MLLVSYQASALVFFCYWLVIKHLLENLIVPNLILPNLIVPNLIVPNLIVPNLIVPNLIVPNLILPNLTVPNLIVPNNFQKCYGVYPALLKPCSVGTALNEEAK